MLPGFIFPSHPTHTLSSQDQAALVSHLQVRRLRHIRFYPELFMSEIVHTPKRKSARNLLKTGCLIYMRRRLDIYFLEIFNLDKTCGPQDECRIEIFHLKICARKSLVKSNEVKCQNIFLEWKGHLVCYVSIASEHSYYVRNIYLSNNCFCYAYFSVVTHAFTWIYMQLLQLR